MRVRIIGESLTAKALRSLVALDPTLVLGEQQGLVTLQIAEVAGIAHPHVDGVDSAVELKIVSHLHQLGPVTLDRRVGQGVPDAITIRLPDVYREEQSVKIESAIHRGLLDAARLPQRPAGEERRLVPERRRAWWDPRRLVPLVLLLLWASAAAAQTISVRDSATGAVVPNIGDDPNNALRVNIVAGAGSGGTAMADRATFTFGTSNLTPIGGVFDDTPPSVLTTGMVGVPRLTANRALHVNLRDASGTAVTVTGNSLNVNCTGGCGGAVAFEDNDAFTFNTTSINIFGAVVDDTTPNAVTEDSAGAPRMSASRILYSNLRDASGNQVITATTTPGASDRALVVRNIPSGTQTVSGTVAISGSVTTVYSDVDATPFSAAGIALIGAMYDTTPPALTDGDAGTPRMSVNRELFSVIRDAAGNDRGANVNASNALLVAQTGELPAGTQNIGDVDVLTFPDNEPFNLNQIAGTGISTGVGASGAGTQRTAALIHDGTDTALVSGTGSLQVTCDNCGGASPFADDDPFTISTSAISVIGAIVDETTPTNATENSAAAPRMSPNRALHGVIRDAAGNERGANVTAANALVVDNSGVTQPVSHNALTELVGAIVEDNDAFTANTSSVFPTAFLVDDTAITTIAEDAVGAARMSTNRVLYSNPTNGTGAALFPNAAAAADNTANPTISGIGAFTMVWDGANWDRAPGTSADGMLVNLGANNDVVGTLAADGVASGTNRVGTLPAIAETGTLPTLNDGRNASLYVDTSGLAYTRTEDPCSKKKLKAAGVLTSAATTEIINASASNTVYICSIAIGPTAGANNVALVEDATNACASPDAGLYGGTTAANGWNIAANGGLTLGSGTSTVTFTASTNVDVCLISSTAAVTPYVITYVLAP